MRNLLAIANNLTQMPVRKLLSGTIFEVLIEFYARNPLKRHHSPPIR